MIQNVLRRRIVQHLTRSTRLFSTPRIGPSPTTTIKLNSLPNSSTFQSLSETLKDLEFRKVQLEPGCVLHFSNEAHAKDCKAKVDCFNNQSALTSRISSTTIPSLLLKNLPASFAPSEFLKHLSPMDPKYSQYFCGKEIQIVVKNAQDAIELSKLIKSTEIIKNDFEIQNVEVRKVKLPNETYVVTVPIISPTLLASKSIVEVKDSLISLLPKDLIQTVSVTNNNESVVIRVAKDIHNEVKFNENLIKVLEKHQVEHKISAIRRPVLILRNFGDFDDDVLNNLIQSVQPDKIQYNSRSSDVKGNILLHFNSEKIALKALNVLKTETSKGGPQHKKFHVSFKEISEPTIKVSNMKAARFSLSKLEEVVKSFSHHTKLELIEDDALITLMSPSEATLIVHALQNRYEERGLVVETVTNDDIGIALTSVSEEKLKALLDDLVMNNINTKSYSVSTHRNLSIGFLTLQQVNHAKRYFYERTSSELLNDHDSVVIADISFMTAFALEVSGLSTDMSVKQLIDDLALDYKVMKTDRCALLKVKRHLQIVPAMKKLKAIVMDGSKLYPTRYRPLSGLDTVNATEYDQFENPEDEVFDTFALRKLLKDYLHTDPATRYQIAKNLFERQLSEAKGPRDKSKSDINTLLDNSFTSQSRAEAADLLINGLELDDEGRIKSNEATQRLFQLYLQRQDMSAFLKDFKEFQSALGEEHHDDVYNWSQFRIVTNKEMDDYQDLDKNKSSLDTSNPNKNKKMLKKVAAAQLLLASSSSSSSSDEDTIDIPSSFERQHRVNTTMSEDDEEEEDEDDDEDYEEYEDDDGTVHRKKKSIYLKAQSSGESDEKISLEDIDMLTDRDGRVWSGIILNTDTVQKPMPGNRMVSHRALVVVGNLKGSCGMGMGKSKSVSDAIKGAFRDALRNLVHIDLYDNFGLAHDLYGKHNSCHAYIRATPRERRMVASPFATSILHRFGISTASVKVAGRRNPYAMCRALFNALAKHENLDETAKSRGMRYLTVRAAFQNGV